MIAAQQRAVESLIDRVGAVDAGPRRIGKLVAHDAGMMEVTGFDYPLGFGGSIRTADGRKIKAEIAGFRGSRAR